MVMLTYTVGQNIHPITHIILFLVSHFNFLFIPCGRLSWLPVSFLLHVKYTLSYCIVFCNNFVKLHYIWIIFGKQNCNEITHISSRLFSPYLVKESSFITAVTYALKVMTVTDKHYSKCSVFVLALRHALKQSRH